MGEPICPRCGSARLVTVQFIAEAEPRHLCEDCEETPTGSLLILAELRAIREQLELLNRSIGLKAEAPLLVEIVR